MDRPSFSTSSTMRHCLVITSCPPVLAMCVVMLMGLVLLVEDISLVPKFHYSRTLSEREIPDDVSTDVIFGKRISKIWKVEDFIVQRRAARPSRAKKDIVASFEEQSLTRLDPDTDMPTEQRKSVEKSVNHEFEHLQRQKINVKFDTSTDVHNKNEDIRLKEIHRLRKQIDGKISNNLPDLENNTDSSVKEMQIFNKHLGLSNSRFQLKERSQEKERKLMFKNPGKLSETIDDQKIELSRKEAVVLFSSLGDNKNDTGINNNKQISKFDFKSSNHTLNSPISQTINSNGSSESLPETKLNQTTRSDLPETKLNQATRPDLPGTKITQVQLLGYSKIEKSGSKGELQNSPAEIHQGNPEAKNKPKWLPTKTRRDHRKGRLTNLGDDNGYYVTSTKHRSKLHDKMVNQFRLKDGAQRDSFINLHRYEYVFDSQACSTGNPKFAILIHSKFSNFVKRAKIRNTFARNRTASGVQFAVSFILGKPNIDSLVDANSREMSELKREELEKIKWRKYNETMHRLEVESNVFKDIVMGNFTDSYRNLTIKHILAYDWLLKRCKGPGFVLKVDDDILVNTFRIARLVKQAAGSNDNRGLLICDVPEGHKVIRSNSNKWFVSQEEYPFRFYPPWCKGYGVFMSRDVVKKLYLASSDIRDFWIDDVYVTGILAWRAGIQVRNFRQKHATVTHNQFEPNDIHAMFVWTRFNKNHSHRMYWKAMVAAQENL